MGEWSKGSKIGRVDLVGLKLGGLDLVGPKLGGLDLVGPNLEGQVSGPMDPKSVGCTL